MKPYSGEVGPADAILVETWIASKRLTNFRAAWVPEHLRNYRVYTFATKDAAAEWAAHLETFNRDAKFRGVGYTKEKRT